MNKTRIEVKVEFEGIHNWPEAPDEVKFLRHPHRHMFGVVLRIPVTHDDRELEFVMVKRELEQMLELQHGTSGNTHLLGRLSCEQIAEQVINWCHIKYDRYGIECGVFEDGENGCWVEDDGGPTGE